uniref:hypothetical protein n=1 Tax=Ophiocordyceps sobolifera TaxID=94213 RepID=UPI0030E32A00
MDHNRYLLYYNVVVHPNLLPMKRPINLAITYINPYLFGGLLAGKVGCFLVDLLKTTSYKLGYGYCMRIIISQDSRDRILINHFINLFDCGYLIERDSYIEFRVSNFKYIYS